MIYKDGTDGLRLSNNILPLSGRVVSYTSKTQSINGSKMVVYSVVDPGGPRGHAPQGPVKISHEKDGHRRQPHRFHVSYPVTRPLDPLLILVLDIELRCPQLKYLKRSLNFRISWKVL